jgi:putative endonuclease
MEAYTTYCLWSQKHNKIYIGYTSDLIQRFYSHNRLSTKGFTAKYRPWIVAYSEVFCSIKEATIREKQLKSSRGRSFLRQYIIDHY